MLIKLFSLSLAADALDAWIGAKNEECGSKTFRWLSDNSVVDTSLFLREPSENEGLAGLVESTAGENSHWIKAKPRNLRAYPACELIQEGTGFF